MVSVSISIWILVISPNHSWTLWLSWENAVNVTLLAVTTNHQSLKNGKGWKKAARGKQQTTYKGTPIRLSADFSAGTLQVGRDWHDICKVMKGKNLHPRILYSARLLFRFDREIKSCIDKQRLKEFSTTKPALQQMLKELLQVQKKRPQLDIRKLWNKKAHQ